MRLIQNNVWTTIEDAQIHEMQTIKDTLSVQPSGYKHMPKYKQGIWDGWISFLKKDKFLSGLTPIVIDALKEKCIKGTLIKRGNNTETTVPSERIGPITLRNYQMEAVEICLKESRGILDMATNAGKTAIMASVIKCTGSSAIVIVPGKALLKQTIEDFYEMLDVDIGVYGSGQYNIAPVTISTLSSFKKLVKDHPKYCKTVNTLWIDEVHRAKATSIYENAQKVHAPIRIGGSGTPLTGDPANDYKIQGTTGTIIYEISNRELVQLGWSTKPIIIFTEIDNVNLNVQYEMAYDECIVNNKFRNEIIVDIAKEEMNFGPCMIFVDRILHAAKIHHLIPESRMVTSKLANFVEAMDDINNGALKCLITTPVIREGVNIPDLQSIILASGGKSHIKLLQRVGRSLRKSEEKKEVRIYDFIDSTNDYLFNHSQKRYDTFTREGFEITMRGAK